jgi:hypothetical protein
VSAPSGVIDRAAIIRRCPKAHRISRDNHPCEWFSRNTPPCLTAQLAG